MVVGLFEMVYCASVLYTAYYFDAMYENSLIHASL